MRICKAALSQWQRAKNEEEEGKARQVMSLPLVCWRKERQQNKCRIETRRGKQNRVGGVGTTKESIIL